MGWCSYAPWIVRRWFGITHGTVVRPDPRWYQIDLFPAGQLEKKIK
jgi:hypothetical protein